MKVKKALRTSDLAREAAISAQLVRNYERMGFIPTAQRGPQGYRLYEQRHLHALQVSRTLIDSFGWWHALSIMQCINKHDISGAVELIDARHAEIHTSRTQIKETLAILHATATAIPPPPKLHDAARAGIYVGEAAKRAGIRVSAVRFWEMQGLIHPTRDRESKYRLYNEEQVRNIQVTVLLRKAGYDFDAIRAILKQLASGTSEQALAAADNKLKELAQVSRRCFEATAALWSYVEETQKDS